MGVDRTAAAEGRASDSWAKRHPDRLVFQGTLFLPHTGIAWEHLTQEFSFGSGLTCWRRLAGWTEAGVWPRLHQGITGGPRRDKLLLTGAGRAAESVRAPQQLDQQRVTPREPVVEVPLTSAE
ncbi:transposase [Streptomyces sp. NPDC057781]|uniref:transposase n=1 Tax=unclassified Streptomyces TaxID=2593676 RepID=UPI00367AAB36